MYVGPHENSIFSVSWVLLRKFLFDLFKRSFPLICIWNERLLALSLFLSHGVVCVIGFGYFVAFSSIDIHYGMILHTNMNLLCVVCLAYIVKYIAYDYSLYMKLSLFPNMRDQSKT